jgi:hypothetical protein
MSRFSIIIFPFFYAKISRKEEIFSKNSGKFSPAAAENQNVSSRRRERHRLTPLFPIYLGHSFPKDAPREKLYKNCVIEFLFTCSNGFLIFKLNNLLECHFPSY